MTSTQELKESAPASLRAPASRPRSLVVRSFGATDRGKQRATNEDQFAVATLAGALWVRQSSVPQPSVRYAEDRGHLFIVADGMGGHRGGGEASALAVGAVEDFLLHAIQWLLRLEPEGEGEVLHEFQAALRAADDCVTAAALANPGLAGMGTTLTMAYAVGADLFVAHVGDSRCYLLRHGRLQALTRDDTIVQELVEHGVITPESAKDHQFRHVITNVVGGPNAGVTTEVHRVALESGDAILLCTDGLTGMLDDADISSVVLHAASPEDAARHLIDLANARGGDDNVTAVVARFD